MPTCRPFARAHSAMNIANLEALKNHASESALCGALMARNEAIDGVADTLSPEHFSDPFLSRLYSLIVREHSLGHAANPITLQPYLIDDPDISILGGTSYLAKLTGALSTMLSVKDLGAQISKLAQRRNLVVGMQNALALALDPGATTEAVADLVEGALLVEHDVTGLHQPAGAQCIEELLRSLDEPNNGIRCGAVPSIDEVLGALRPKQFVIAAGRPGMGKTAVALSYGIGAAKRGHGVLFVSLEMSSTELGTRMAADMCYEDALPVPFENLNDGQISRTQVRQILAARDKMAELPVRVADASRLTVSRLNRLVRQWVRKFAAQGQKLELVIIDYLQLVSPDAKGRSQYEAVSEVSRGLKAIAKEHKVAVMALAQLSRDIEKRKDKRPKLADLRDSGQIEQDADAVLFLYRNEYYLRAAEPPPHSPKHAAWERGMADCKDVIEFICAKRRNGRPGSAKGKFFAEFQAVRG
jgi:replicative DNA helicase